MMFTSSSVFSVVIAALSVAQPVFAQGYESDEVLPIQDLDLNACSGLAGARYYGPSAGSSQGSPFCATQFNVSDPRPTVVRAIQTWSDGSKVHGIQIFFTNNKFMRLGETSNATNIDVRKLDLKPSTASIAGFSKTNKTGNIEGFQIKISTGESLSAGNPTGHIHADTPNYTKYDLAVAFSGFFGANGLEQLILFTAGAVPRPGDVTVLPLPSPTSGSMKMNDTLPYRVRYVN